jgi:hypothetical protein
VLALGLFAVGCSGGGGSDPVSHAQAGRAGQAGSAGASGSSAGLGGAGAAGASGGGTGGAPGGSSGSSGSAGSGGQAPACALGDYRHCMGSTSCDEQCGIDLQWTGVCECASGGAGGEAGAAGSSGASGSAGLGGSSGTAGSAGKSGAGGSAGSAGTGGSAGLSGSGGVGGDPDCAPSNTHPLPMKCVPPKPTQCGFPGNATLCSNTGQSAICPDNVHLCALWTGNDYSVCSDGRVKSCPTGTCGYDAGIACNMLESDGMTFCPCVSAGAVMP